jgi:hypothetical protein
VLPDADRALLLALARTLQSHFTLFIKKGAPNDGSVTWPADAAVAAANRASMTFALPLPLPFCSCGINRRHALAKDDYCERETAGLEFWQSAPFDAHTSTAHHDGCQLSSSRST